MNIVKLHMGKATALIAVLFSVTVPAVAQELKLGVVNVPVLIEQAPQARAAMAALEKEFQPRSRAVLAKQAELKELSEKVQRDIAVMGETERRNAEKDLRDLQRSVLKEVQEYADAAGLDLVVGDGVLYASTTVNITENVLRAMEANFQAAGN